MGETTGRGAFDVVRLSDSVWAAVGRNGSSNAGFIRTDEGVVVVDTLASESAGAELRSVVEEETHSPVKIIVLTHHHADHWAGLAAWGGVDVVAHPRTVEILRSVADSYGLQPGDVLPFPALLELWVGHEPARWLGVDSSNGIVTRLRDLARRDAPRFWLPRPVEAGTVLVEDADVTVEVRDLGAGHGDDDLTVWITDHGSELCMLGDQAFFDRVPVVGGDHLAEWAALAGRLESDPTRIIVPGHGRPAAGAALRHQTAYLTALWSDPCTPLPLLWDDERSRDWHTINAGLIELYRSRSC